MMLGSPCEFSAARRARLAGAACTALLAIPWLWPFTAGPTPNVLPLLAAWGCGLTALALLVVAPRPAAVLQSSAAHAWLVAAVLSAVLGVLQWFDFAPRSLLLNAAQVGEAYGNLRQRNQFATLMAIGLAALVFRPPAGWRFTALVAAGLLAAGCALSASRTGLLEFLVLAVLAATWPGPRKARLVLCAAALGAYALVAAVSPALLLAWRGVEAPNVFVRIAGDLGCSSRKVLWSNVVYLIAQKPWTGWGLGELDYAHFATLYPGERFCDILDNAHSLPLQIAVELGIPAAGIAVVAAALACWRGRPWAEGVPSRQLAWAVLGVIGLHSMLEYPLWYGPFQVAALAALGLLVRWAAPAARWRATVVVACLLGVLGIAWAAAVYDRVSDAYRPPQSRRPALAIDPVRSLGRPMLFVDQVKFAELSLATLNAESASRVHALAAEMLHYSPEPAVIEKLAESARLLGREDEAAWLAARYRAAFPDAYARWLLSAATPPGGARSVDR